MVEAEKENNLTFKHFLIGFFGNQPTNKFMNTMFRFCLTVCLTFAYQLSIGQPGIGFEIKKPKKYETRKLKAEKTGEKKFNLPRRAFQNTVTHYNYYFNANTRLNDVVARAKAAFKDDYSQLLPFYNYTLQATATDKSEIDSVIYKCTAGILLHDLRNDWIDNMYLLLGKAYFFRNDLDSADMTLQYLNYAFAPKEESGYDKPIGSNASTETGEFSISTNEKKNKGIWGKLTGHKPSRNESFVWQARNHIEKDELPEAAGVLEILRYDPNFPKRLKSELSEAMAYWFYKERVYDSAAHYLSKSLDEAENKQEEARWEFLIGQLYQLSNNNDKAIEYYDRSIKHTTDPIMDVFARLNSIRAKGGNDENFLQKNIDELLKMAQKDKYENFRDIIYYSAATIELQRDGFANAQNYLLKSAKYSTNNPEQRSKSFMLLGDVSYNRKAYSDAYNFYDSTDENLITNAADKERLLQRKPSLKIIATNVNTIKAEDSLQALAKLPADQREAIVRKKVKQIRKEQGLAAEETNGGNPAVRPQSTDLFADPKNTEFYFYNASLKARGFSEFRSKWGQRPNADNWRRAAANSRMVSAGSNATGTVKTDSANTGNAASYDALLSTIPLDEEKLAASNKHIMEALYSEAKTFSEKLEDYPSAIETYEELMRRFPNNPYKEEVLFNLIYAYQKTGDKSKADQYRTQLSNGDATNKWVQLIKNPQSGNTGNKNTAATKKYEEIYNLFIEGKFDQAKEEKKAADNQYGTSYWTPQLLFIESIYYIKQKEDTAAIRVLSSLVSLHASSPMAERAKTMIDVLKRRNEIENYLSNLQVQRKEDNTARTITQSSDAVKQQETKTQDVPPVAKQDVPPAKQEAPPVKTEIPQPKKETLTPPIVNKSFTFVPTDAHYVVVVLDKVDPVYASEAKNAFNRFNKERYYQQQIEMSSVQLNEALHLVLQGPFSDANAAVDYINKTQPQTRSRILPWLAADKYSFLVISAANLNVLKENKDMTGYKQLIQQAFPGKF
jgi:outer membrane protein assembly factor BamD (BamD/ComL family)